MKHSRDINIPERTFSKDKRTSDISQDNHIKTSKKAIMNEVTIPRYLTSRLNLLAEKLDMNEKDTLEALFDWAEVSLSLGDILELDELKPNILYDKVENLTIQVEQTVSSNSPDISDSEEEEEGEEEDLPFDKESIRDLCNSVRLLSEIIAIDHGGEKTRKKSDRSIEAEIIINHAIDKLQQYNAQEGLAHEDKFRISNSLLRKMCDSGDVVIKRVLEERNIDQYNLENEFSSRHNTRGVATVPVNEVVPLDEEFLAEEIAAVFGE